VKCLAEEATCASRVDDGASNARSRPAKREVELSPA
jgi:hypothetical protein